ncbi:hypothetical protein BDB00DRAFT_826788 [Zychaea mexicana]|uniref:uncharacterized protein n=1 Tax=Zychaea mexicana TaxID=64656 RepID=UPI0022FECF2D|nr:uncharacterized protein BDB00DRAFT_826788 [Zychaea mexicana]KAI9492695.1 hypothetical protein BDB00DRAFT_826788 [Zychaea mexicana]
MTLPMLEFHKQILADLVDEDALLIMSPGLGLFKVLTSFIELHTKGNHFVLVLNTSQAQDAAIVEKQAAMGLPPSDRLQIVDNETTSESRSAMYRKGGVFSVTSRILAVDLLLDRVATAMISGIVMYNAHRVRPNSMEELILRIYRKKNDQGFIKAFSDQPEQFTTGFAPLENTLKTLQLRKVHLWPRFQVLVSDNLAQASVDVVELRQPMTDKMDTIQKALVECMEATLSEVRRQNTMVDVQEFTIENSFFRSFDMIIRRQLDPIWHRISPATKQLVGDLNTLRRLLSYLTAYDPVSFFYQLQVVITSNSAKDGAPTRQSQSQWLFLDAADKAISTARKRVYLKKNDTEYATAEGPIVSDGSAQIRLVPEELPKWNLLHDILQEIEQDMPQKDAPVLIMVNGTRTCSQLRQYISGMKKPTEGDEPMPILSRLIQWFFSLQKSMYQIQQEDSSASTTTTTTSGTSATNTQSLSSSGPSSNRTSQPVQRGSAPANKRRRVRGGSAAAASSPSSRSRSIVEALQTNIVQETVDLLNDPGPQEKTESEAMEKVTMGEDDILPEFQEVTPGSIISIQTYDNDVDEDLLEDLQPRFIIMYDPNPTFVRRVEVYRAMHPELDVRVYFMIYENSVEEQNYLSMIRKEKEAFERLIREKSIMAIPMPQRGTPQQDAFARAVSTRVAGGQLRTKGPPVVIVDMREFRSSLPPILYAEGLKIIPCTLQVGDYILSPTMCVERKSIPDLISSLNSGRLYTQCENMCLHYETPIVLIEFDENKSFSLQSLSEMKSSVSITDLSSKLVLLTLTFPKVKVIWSSSPHETAAVFDELKKSEEEPEVEKAVLVGAESTDDVNSAYNMTPQDILRSLPGVTSKNYKILMNAVENLQQLFRLSVEDLKKLIGEEPARKLHQFIHHRAGQQPQ